MPAYQYIIDFRGGGVTANELDAPYFELFSSWLQNLTHRYPKKLFLIS